MATPRKNWFKVADSVAFEDWPNDVAATFLRLGAYLNTRWARDGRSAADRGRTTLSSAVLQQLTGSGSLARARRVLHELATHITLVIDEQGTSTVVEWPKYAEFQGSESGTGASTETDASPGVPSPSPISEPSPSPSLHQPNEEKKKRPPAPRAPCVSRGKFPCPEGLDPQAKERIRIWAAKSGIDANKLTYGWQAVRDWAAAGNKRQADWEATFRNALRKGWCLEGYAPPSGTPSSRYRSADDVIADAKRKQAEDDAKRAADTPEQIGQVIDMSLQKSAQ